MNNSITNPSHPHRRAPVDNRSIICTNLRLPGLPPRSWTELMFKKYRGSTLPQVLFTDPDWFFWAIANHIIKHPNALVAEAELLNIRARRIRIPSLNGRNREAEYYFDRTTGKFSHFELVDANQPQHRGGSRTIRKAVIDLSVVRESRGYDKLGYKHFLSCLRTVLLGNESARMTKGRAEAFFDDPVNFYSLVETSSTLAMRTIPTGKLISGA